MAAGDTFSIGALAAAAGVSRRTVRFYVARGLLAPPFGLGRGARYSQAHLDRLLEIRASHGRGVSLQELRDRGAAPERPPAPGRPTPARPAAPRGPETRPSTSPDAAPGERDTWWAAWDESPSDEIAAALRYVPGRTWLAQPLAMGYELHLPAGRAPLSTRQLNELAERLFELLEAGKRH